MAEQNKLLFNANQLATFKQAKDLAEQIEEYRLTHDLFMGGGVKLITNDAETSGIYLPSWAAGPGGFEEPNDSDTNSYFFHFRFNNGRAGINVGLILDKIKRYGGNINYVFWYLNSGDLQ